MVRVVSAIPCDLGPIHPKASSNLMCAQEQVKRNLETVPEVKPPSVKVSALTDLERPMPKTYGLWD